MRKFVLIILVLILSILLVSGCLEQSLKTLDDNYKNIKTQFPTQTTSGLSPDEQKLIGTWKHTFYPDNYMKLTFKDDRNYIDESNLYGKRYGTYSISGNSINLVGTDGTKTPISYTYRFVDNNNLILTIGSPYNFERTWW